ncbi:MAG: hypothetical protein HQM09_04925 [Candidatus Riflebacteria bacterium]|nr:hypothetical protein [Candidatus Riflebacteria bacterium]
MKSVILAAAFSLFVTWQLAAAPNSPLQAQSAVTVTASSSGSDSVIPAEDPVLVKPLSEIATFQVDLGSLGVLELIKDPNPGAIGRFDELVLKKDRKAVSGISIFKTEGRQLVDVQIGAFTASGAKDIALTLDTGGTGGFVDILLLSKTGETISPIWEDDTIKGGRVSFQKGDSNHRPRFVVWSLNQNLASGKIASGTHVFEFDAGKMIEVGSDTSKADQ